MAEETEKLIVPQDVLAQTVQPTFSLSVKVKTWTIFKDGAQVSVHASESEAKGKMKSLGVGHVYKEIDVGFETRNQDQHAEAMVAHIVDMVAKAPPHPINRYKILHNYPVPFTCNDGTVEMRMVGVPISVSNRVNAILKAKGYKVEKQKRKNGSELPGWNVTKPAAAS